MRNSWETRTATGLDIESGPPVPVSITVCLPLQQKRPKDTGAYIRQKKEEHVDQH